MSHRSSPLSFSDHRLHAPRELRARAPHFHDALDRATLALKGYADARRDDFVVELADRVDNLERRVESMRKKKSELSGEILRDLDAKLAEARKKVEDARSSTSSAWDEIRDGTVDSWRRLSESVQAAVDHLAR